MARLVKWFWSGRAAVIAFLAVFFDFILHYLLPDNIAIREGLPYFGVKFVVVEVTAAALLSMKMGKSLREAKPFLIGFVGASVFGAIYYALPWISAEPGYLTLPYRLLWGVFHALVIWFAAAFILDRPRQTAIAFILLVAAVALGILVPLGGY